MNARVHVLVTATLMKYGGGPTFGRLYPQKIPGNHFEWTTEPVWTWNEENLQSTLRGIEPVLYYYSFILLKNNELAGFWSFVHLFSGLLGIFVY